MTFHQAGCIAHIPHSDTQWAGAGGGRGRGKTFRGWGRGKGGYGAGSASHLLTFCNNSPCEKTDRTNVKKYFRRVVEEVQAPIEQFKTTLSYVALGTEIRLT